MNAVLVQPEAQILENIYRTESRRPGFHIFKNAEEKVAKQIAGSFKKINQSDLPAQDKAEQAYATLMNI